MRNNFINLSNFFLNTAGLTVYVRRLQTKAEIQDAHRDTTWHTWTQRQGVLGALLGLFAALLLTSLRCKP